MYFCCSEYILLQHEMSINVLNINEGKYLLHWYRQSYAGCQRWTVELFERLNDSSSVATSYPTFPGLKSAIKTEEYKNEMIKHWVIISSYHKICFLEKLHVNWCFSGQQDNRFVQNGCNAFMPVKVEIFCQFFDRRTINHFPIGRIFVVSQQRKQCTNAFSTSVWSTDENIFIAFITSTKHYQLTICWLLWSKRVSLFKHRQALDAD